MAGRLLATNQVLYNLSRRGIEFELLPWCQTHKIPVMAYSPIEQGRMLNHPALARIAKECGVTPAAVALAFVLSHDGVIAIPKSSTSKHIRENRRAVDVKLTADQLGALDQAFAPPRGKRPLEML